MEKCYAEGVLQESILKYNLVTYPQYTGSINFKSGLDIVQEAKKEPHKDQPLIILARTCPYKGMNYLKKRFPRLHYVRFKSEEERSIMNIEISKELGIEPIEY